MQTDDLLVVNSDLRPDEARMLRELLESSGIAATVYNAGLGSTEQWDPVGGAAKVAVFQGDAQRAQEIIAASGIVPGPGPDERVEIPEEEWMGTAPRDRWELPAGEHDSTWHARRRRLAMYVIIAGIVASWIVAAVAGLLRCGGGSP